ncbi:1,4-alpha-glucan-branching enzyme [Parasponia andersonii]|uniref:1,4-alpha-glucan-branching enzyme n=1 Tax=Parasponia andersonii TaxID=3476 RepID=A0A2P5BRA4_PARAD|nr:1,4-alpha-glucan-branching enzyme [Parasponia andersonii]
MHMQLLRNNKVVMFDRTDFGPSNISLGGGRCRFDPADTALQVDCTAHSVLYDVASNSFRPLMVQTDLWCSSGAVLPNGTLVQTGGYNDGDHVIRAFTPCINDICDWIETPNYLAERRWYATNQILPNGDIIIIGGRRQFNFEFFPKIKPEKSSLFQLNFLRETSDSDENNLYPFVHLLPDGNLFIFANTRSILFNYNQNSVIKEFPSIPNGEPRNYPSSGSSVLLPLDQNKPDMEVEIMICGGAPRRSHREALEGNFVEALSSCGRLMVSDRNPSWEVEYMPISRVMGDMVILPSGDVIIINGAGKGTAGWEASDDPVTTPVIYRPTAERNNRFWTMEPSRTPRLYHSAVVLLPDGRVLVGGSNPHVYYNFTRVKFPTELSLESFSPPYLSAEYRLIRPRIVAAASKVLEYAQLFSVIFTVAEYTTPDSLSFRIIAPSFSTHSFGMNQRMVVMKLTSVSRVTVYSYNATVLGPSKAEIAPPGYYMLFVVHSGIPSPGTWVKLQ